VIVDIRVREPPVAGALRRPRRAWAASENGRSVDTGCEQDAGNANAAYMTPTLAKFDPKSDKGRWNFKKQ
jgi:hypothetical protein